MEPVDGMADVIVGDSVLVGTARISTATTVVVVGDGSNRQPANHICPPAKYCSHSLEKMSRSARRDPLPTTRDMRAAGGPSEMTRARSAARAIQSMRDWWTNERAARAIERSSGRNRHPFVGDLFGDSRSWRRGWRNTLGSMRQIESTRIDRGPSVSLLALQRRQRASHLSSGSSRVHCRGGLADGSASTISAGRPPTKFSA